MAERGASEAEVHATVERGEQYILRDSAALDFAAISRSKKNGGASITERNNWK